MKTDEKLFDLMEIILALETKMGGSRWGDAYLHAMLRKYGFPAEYISELPPLFTLMGTFLDLYEKDPNKSPSLDATGHCANVRKVLFEESSKKFEVVGIYWPTNARSREHDHGIGKRTPEYPGSHGITFVAEGAVYEIKDDVTNRYQEGDFLTELPTTVHLVGNDGKSGAFTFHFYFPPLTGNSTVFQFS